MKLNETPDQFKLSVGSKEVSLTHNLLAATTFCFAGDAGNQVILSSKSTHPTIYKCFKALSQCEEQDWKKTLNTYGCAVVLGRLSKEVINDFMKLYYNSHGNPRYGTFSGRLWNPLFTKEVGWFAALSFWSRKHEFEDNPQIIPLVQKAFKLKHKLYWECLDSGGGKLYDKGVDDTPPAGAYSKSKIAPHLTPAQLIDIVSRAHSAPHTLSSLERRVALELRGRKPKKALTGGYPSPAEFNFHRVLGDDINKKPFTGLFG